MNCAPIDKHFDICFLILHFLDGEMTQNCVKTLLHTLEDKSIFVLIVDNGSCNSSGENLQKIFNDFSNVHVLINESNLGFANGNNSGYVWLKNNYTFDYLCVLNNDILIEQDDFLERIINKYDDYQFSVLGPDIVLKDNGHHQNPIFFNGLSFSELKKFRDIMTFRKKIFPMYYFKELSKQLLKSVFHIQRPTPNDIFLLDDNHPPVIYNPVLHGACYIFSKNYTTIKDELFDKNTFMYFEENILHYDCMKNDMTMIYCPDIFVTHCEDVSTKAFIKNNYHREKWILNESLKSVTYFFELMQNDINKGIYVFEDESFR